MSLRHTSSHGDETGHAWAGCLPAQLIHCLLLHAAFTQDVKDSHEEAALAAPHALRLCNMVSAMPVLHVVVAWQAVVISRCDLISCCWLHAAGGGRGVGGRCGCSCAAVIPRDGAQGHLHRLLVLNNRCWFSLVAAATVQSKALLAASRPVSACDVWILRGFNSGDLAS